MPLPSGYAVRPATRDDLEAIVAVMRAAEAAVCGSSTLVAGEVSCDWADPRLDMSRDTWVALGPDGDLVAYAFCWGVDPDHPIDLFFDVHPDRGDVGLDAHLLGLLLARARQHAATRGPGAGAAVFAVWYFRGDERKRALFEALGVVHRRVFLRMVIAAADLQPAPPWPEGVVVTPFRRGVDDGDVHAAIEDAFSEHFHATHVSLDTWRAQVLDDPDFDPDLQLVARDGDEVAGAVLCFPTPDVGIVDQLAVRKPWRGRGLGTALLLHALHLLATRGHTHLQLGVDSENTTGAADLYLKIGMTPTRVTDLYEGTLDVGES